MSRNIESGGLQQLPVSEEKKVTPTEGTRTQKVAGADGNTSNTRQVGRNRQQGKLFSQFSRTSVHFTSTAHLKGSRPHLKWSIAAHG